MGTKKEKRARGLAKHEAEMARLRETGLAAQQKDREYRAHVERQEWEPQHEKKHSWKKRIKECPLCQDELRATKKASEDG